MLRTNLRIEDAHHQLRQTRWSSVASAARPHLPLVRVFTRPSWSTRFHYVHPAGILIQLVIAVSTAHRHLVDLVQHPVDAEAHQPMPRQRLDVEPLARAAQMAYSPQPVDDVDDVAVVGVVLAVARLADLRRLSKLDRRAAAAVAAAALRRF